MSTSEETPRRRLALLCASFSKQKSLEEVTQVLHDEDAKSTSKYMYGLFDLLCIGIGSTVG